MLPRDLQGLSRVSRPPWQRRASSCPATARASHARHRAPRPPATVRRVAASRSRRQDCRGPRSSSSPATARRELRGRHRPLPDRAYRRASAVRCSGQSLRARTVHRSAPRAPPWFLHGRERPRNAHARRSSLRAQVPPHPGRLGRQPSSWFDYVADVRSWRPLVGHARFTGGIFTFTPGGRLFELSPGKTCDWQRDAQSRWHGHASATITTTSSRIQPLFVSRHRLEGRAIITSVDFTIAMASSPRRSFSARTASAVITAVSA